MNNVVSQMLDDYKINTVEDETNALKEVIQEIVLCALARSGFFKEAAFYGGTALRIFYGLNRFSEDLDFTLLNKNEKFDFSKYFNFIEDEVNAYGFDLKISKKDKSIDSNIESAFLKGNTYKNILTFFPKSNIKESNYLLKDIKIKFEVDINPPAGALYEIESKFFPSYHEVKLYDFASLFAGKIHAILCRNWKKRVKGRDLYDFVFFLSKGSNINLKLLKSKLIESKAIDKNDKFDINILKNMLKDKFSEIDYKKAKEDIYPFIKDTSSIEKWNKDFFVELLESIY